MKTGSAFIISFGLASLAFFLDAGAQPSESAATVGAEAASVEALVSAARAAAQTDRNRESVDLFARAIELAPQRRAEWLQEYADQLVYSGSPAQAVPLYREALTPPRTRDQQMRSLKGLGTALLWAGRPSQARTVLQTYLQEKPGDQDARRLLGRALSWGGRQREAIAHLEQLLRDHPDDQEARVQLAQAQAWMGRSDQAEEALAGVTQPRDDARRLREDLALAQAPRTMLDTQRSSQSDNLGIVALRLSHSLSFDSGRGTAGARLERFDYEKEDGSDSAQVTRPMLYGRYRLNDAFELNIEAGRDRIEPRSGPARQPAVYASWLTWRPSDLFRFDLSTSQNTFDNLRSLRLGLTLRQNGLSMDFTPSERERYAARIDRASYSDGNHRDGGQLEAEYRWLNQPEAWVGLKHTRFSFERQLDNGYFNPRAFNSTQLTLRTLWRPDGYDGRWDLGAYAAIGRENAQPDGSKPIYDLSLRAGLRIDARTRLEARAQRFSSRTSSSGFARSTVGLALERKW